MVVSTPTLQLLEWIDEQPRSYAETIEAWHSHCPRLTIWEDAVGDGLVAVRAGNVALTEKGWGLTPAGSDPSSSLTEKGRGLTPAGSDPSSSLSP